jgi:hypothetical protein
VIRSRRLRLTGYVGHGMGDTYEILVGKPEGKRLLGRLRRRWEDNIEMDLKRRIPGGCGRESCGLG